MAAMPTTKIQSIDDFLGLLKGIKPAGKNQWLALCPSHHDTEQSLSVKEADGKILLKCFAGCELEDILKPLGLEPKDLFLDSHEAKLEYREIEAVKYTARDWIRVYKRNVKWAENHLNKATDPRDRFCWKLYILINMRQLKELQSQQPKPLRKGTSAIQQIKEENDIVEVVGRYTTLKGRNHQYYGLCPLHGDHSPSLSVDSGKQLWHCFSCGKGGDVIDFIKMAETLDTRGAIKKLAGVH